MHARDEGKAIRTLRKLDRRSLLVGAVAAPFLLRRAAAAEAVRAYSIWPENYARPMLEAFEKANGIHVNFVRFSSGEALARLLAEKNNPQVDVLFGGPVETFTAGEDQRVHLRGLYTAQRSGSAPTLQERKGHVDRDRRRSAAFATNTKFLAEHTLKPRRPGTICSIPPTRASFRWRTRGHQGPR